MDIQKVHGSRDSRGPRRIRSYMRNPARRLDCGCGLQEGEECRALDSSSSSSETDASDRGWSRVRSILERRRRRDAHRGYAGRKSFPFEISESDSVMFGNEETPSGQPLDYQTNLGDLNEYFQSSIVRDHPSDWMNKDEIPSSAEIMCPVDEDGEEVPINNVQTAYESKEDYLSTLYKLMRADSIIPIRQAVAAVKEYSYGSEEDFRSSIGIYDDVHIVGITLANRGLAIRVSFSLSRVGKRIPWENSKRLISGSLVALTPSSDMFQSKCIIATVAARPMMGLTKNPPEIDLFFARTNELELDTNTSWLMVEDRSSFFEASRHTMIALQKMMTEATPLEDQLIYMEPEIDPPEYLQENPFIDLTQILSVKDGRFENIDTRQGWPEKCGTTLDDSQYAALQRILSKRVAIVQGPPGTGKTHVSVEAIKTILHNMQPGDPPMIVTCQTNHALDQLLNHVAKFEQNFIRLGGRSKDQGIIKERTLWAIRQAAPNPQHAGSLRSRAQKQLSQSQKCMKVLLHPLEKDSQIFKVELVRRLNLLTQGQVDSLVRGDRNANANTREEDKADVSFRNWLGDSIHQSPRTVRPDVFMAEYEDAELEVEQVRDMEAEATAQDDDFEVLRGETLSLSGEWTAKPYMALKDSQVKALLKAKDLWNIKRHVRGPIFSYLQRNLKINILQGVREEAIKYEAAVHARKVANWDQDTIRMSEAKIIGMTTTGFSKYRAMIDCLRPRIVLVEEAAETLEPPVTATCVPSLQHLILVGDHKQLRPHCQLQDLEQPPFCYNISMFERLVMNKFEYDSLRRQRRMIPEIRRLLRPIYGDIIDDHKSVKDPSNRPDILGMGGLNHYFFTHQWPESRDENMSTCNQGEASFLSGFFNYLVMNNEDSRNITVLTFYNGQRKMINRMLKNHPDLSGLTLNVVTVDSYQGEENDIILLSLVRSNYEHNIGFLRNANRVCVAISRARRGFYMFGNGELLASENGTWANIVKILGNASKWSKHEEVDPPKIRIGFKLPIQCKPHGYTTHMDSSEQWRDHQGGGCSKPCGGLLPCGHECDLTCHPYSHGLINCTQQCDRLLSCGHQCRGRCCEPCSCGKCHSRRPHAQGPTSREPGLIDLRATPMSLGETRSAGGQVVTNTPRILRAPNRVPAMSASGIERVVMDPVSGSPRFKETQKTPLWLIDPNVSEGEDIFTNPKKPQLLRERKENSRASSSDEAVIHELVGLDLSSPQRGARATHDSTPTDLLD